MNNDTKQNALQKSAQKYFTNFAQEGTLAKDTRRKERNIGATKIAKLRALRLAKESTDKEAADKLAAENPVAIPSARRKRAAVVKPARMLRLSY
jgi:hypothetical protein